MTLLSGPSTRALPGNAERDPAPSRLVGDVSLVAGAWSATLALDPDDPYFFDHALDHVPGMALVGGLLDLLRTCGASDPECSDLQMTLSLELSSFSELDRPVLLEAVQHSVDGAPGSFADSKIAFQAQQCGRVVCEGDATFRTSTSPTRAQRPIRPWSPLQIDQTLVHRQRPENVLITSVMATDRARTAAVRRPAAHHRLAADPGQPLRAELLIDAARQFATLISHAEHGAPADTQFVLLGVQAELPCGPCGDVHLRWTPTPAPRGRSRMTIDVITDDPDGEPCGTVSLDYYAATPAVYRRLRRPGRQG